MTLELNVRDADVLSKLQVLVSCYSSITRRTRTTNFARSSETAVWGVFAEEFRVELTALGLPPGRKSAIAAPPTVPFDRAAYLRGLVDGDGSVGFTAHGLPFLSFTTASNALAEHFCTEVQRLAGARRSFNRNRRDSTFNLLVTNDPAAVLASALYPLDCLAITRKYDAARSVAAWTRPSTMRARPTCRQPWTSEHDAVVLAVKDDGEAADQLGRTRRSVSMRRWRLRRPAD